MTNTSDKGVKAPQKRNERTVFEASPEIGGILEPFQCPVCGFVNLPPNGEVWKRAENGLHCGVPYQSVFVQNVFCENCYTTFEYKRYQ